MDGKLRLGVLAALLLVAGGIGVPTLSAAADSTRTITVVIKPEARFVDLPPAGPSHGDLRVANGPLYNEQGTEVIGDHAHVCTVTDPADTPGEQGHTAQCLTTYSLPGGQLTTRGVFTHLALTETSLGGPRAVTGGTGEYQTARGEALTWKQGEQLKVTFHLILAP